MWWSTSRQTYRTTKVTGQHSHVARSGPHTLPNIKARSAVENTETVTPTMCSSADRHNHESGKKAPAPKPPLTNKPRQRQQFTLDHYYLHYGPTRPPTTPTRTIDMTTTPLSLSPWSPLDTRTPYRQKPTSRPDPTPHRNHNPYQIQIRPINPIRSMVTKNPRTPPPSQNTKPPPTTTRSNTV